MKDLIQKLFYLLFQKYILSNPDYRIKQLRTPAQANGSEYYALDFIGLAQLQGREVEWHNVTTDDGYVLSIFRLLPKYVSENDTRKRPVIYLQHPLGADADVYILFGAGRSLAYTLSDAGYDVWLGNCRGTTYSRQHTTLSPDDSEFWDISLEDYALMDLPPMIDYILEATGEKIMSYVGYSVGTTMAFMLLSEKTDYNDKFNALVLLAPISYWKVKQVTSYIYSITFKALQLLLPTAIEIGFQNSAIFKLFKTVCLVNSITIHLCRIPVHIFLGNDDEQFTVDESPRVLLYFPAGVSLKAFYQYVQHAMIGYIQYYDYGDEESNMKHYGESKPPSFNLSRIRAPVILLCGQNDTLSLVDNNEELVRRLPNDTVVTYEVIDQLNHGDFAYAKDAEKLIYRRIVDILQKFLQSSPVVL